MIAIILIALTVLVLLVGGVLAARGRSGSVDSIEQLTALTRPVDLEAFRNLISTSDEEFLRASLPAPQFRRVQRRRLIAAFDYVSRAAHNSSMLLRLGEAGQRSGNAPLVKAGEELANSALHMRLLCLGAMAIIALRIVFPQLRVSIGEISEHYAGTRDRGMAFGRVQQPALASRVDCAL